LISAVLPALGFNIAERAAHTETTWEYSEGSKHDLISDLSGLFIHDLHQALRLVDLSSCLINSLLLAGVTWLVVIT